MSHGAAFLTRTTATISSHPLPSGSGEGLREAAALPKASGPNANVGTEAANPGSSGTVHGRGWGSVRAPGGLPSGRAVRTAGPSRVEEGLCEQQFRRSGGQCYVVEYIFSVYGMSCQVTK